MPHPFLARQILKLLHKAFWPWFLRHVWPHLQNALMDIVKRGLSRARTDMNVSVESAFQQQAQDAESRARQAEGQASSSASESDRKHHEEVARIWREVAEQYRRENERLRDQLAKRMEAAGTDIERQARQLDPQLEEQGGGAQLSVNGQKQDLPRLPMDGGEKGER